MHRIIICIIVLHIKLQYNDTNILFFQSTMLLNVRRYIRSISRSSEGVVVLLENIKENEPVSFTKSSIIKQISKVYLFTDLFKKF